MSGNPLPPSDSNWYRFAKNLDIGILDLDKFASLVGYRDFNDLDISISPRALFKKNPESFIMASKDSSLRAEDWKDADIAAMAMQESKIRKIVREELLKETFLI